MVQLTQLKHQELPPRLQVFNDYGDGVQVIFENGNYDGFSTTNNLGVGDINKTEADTFLEPVGFEGVLAGYQFKNVMQVSADYRNGLFNIVWSEKWKRPAEPPFKYWKVTQHHDDEVCLIKTPIDADEDFALEKFYAKQIDEELTAFGEQPHVSAVPYNPDERQDAPPTLLDCCKRYIRMQDEMNKEMGRKPTNTMYWMMKEAVAEAEK